VGEAVLLVIVLEWNLHVVKLRSHLETLEALLQWHKPTELKLVGSPLEPIGFLTLSTPHTHVNIKREGLEITGSY
jgi:hypothetical protein